MVLRFLRTKAGIEAVLLSIIGLIAWTWAVGIDFFETVKIFLETHESWELDEIIVAINVIGLLGFVYAVSRALDLRREVVRRAKAEKDKDWVANHDLLTRLPNRRGLDISVKAISDKSQRGKKSYAAFSIDLDGFKRVNDLIGHHGGDALLVEVAERLRTTFPDAEIFRLGGDEFLVLFELGPRCQCAAIGQRMVSALTKPFECSGITSEVGASVGFALYPKDAADIADVIRCSDVAMYVAKKSGRNSVCAFEKVMEHDVMRRAETEIALRHAVKNGLIVPYYQPLVDLQTGQIRGFEALARWRTVKDNFVPPAVFIELAEDVGLIIELSEQLLRLACRDALSWPGYTRLAFNISPMQLSDRHLGLRIMKVLDETGLPPSRLEVEITESALVRDLETAAAVLADLHNAGIRIALDDFGTGYSSLSQLSKFKFDKIKIDRSFVTSFESDAKQEKIVRAILGLGQGLGISTTAEGIEEEHQLSFLKSIGCDFGQGYLFGHPVPAEEARELFGPTGQADMQEPIAKAG